MSCWGIGRENQPAGTICGAIWLSNQRGGHFGQHGFDLFRVRRGTANGGVLAGPRQGRMAKGTHGKVANGLAESLGVGHNARTDVSQEIANHGRILEQSRQIKAAILHGLSEGNVRQEMQPRVALPENHRERRFDPLVGPEALDGGHTGTNLAENDLLPVAGSLLHSGIGRFAEKSPEIGDFKGINQIHDAVGAGDMLGAGIFHDVDARLKMFTRVVVQNQSCAGCFAPWFQLVGEGFGQQHHTALTGKPIIHCALHLRLDQPGLLRPGTAEEGGLHRVESGIPGGVSVLHRHVEPFEKRHGQDFGEDRQIVGFPGGLIAHKRDDVLRQFQKVRRQFSPAVGARKVRSWQPHRVQGVAVVIVTGGQKPLRCVLAKNRVATQ